MYSEAFNASCDEDWVHEQDGADPSLALLMVWMVVALRVTRIKMATIALLAMLMIGMILTRTCGSME